jgi:hypothetical protein
MKAHENNKITMANKKIMNKRIENEFLEASNFLNWANKITIKN